MIKFCAVINWTVKQLLRRSSIVYTLLNDESCKFRDRQTFDNEGTIAIPQSPHRINVGDCFWFASKVATSRHFVSHQNTDFCFCKIDCTTSTWQGLKHRRNSLRNFSVDSACNLRTICVTNRIRRAASSRKLLRFEIYLSASDIWRGPLTRCSSYVKQFSRCSILVMCFAVNYQI